MSSDLMDGGQILQIHQTAGAISLAQIRMEARCPLSAPPILDPTTTPSANPSPSPPNTPLERPFALLTPFDALSASLESPSVSVSPLTRSHRL
ncbi:hypothetical protein KM043_008466 [Ampulex compressa]|nr:hypothetical protein KM043_008466 [Ampulex compressa]